LSTPPFTESDVGDLLARSGYPTIDVGKARVLAALLDVPRTRREARPSHRTSLTTRHLTAPNRKEDALER
jgi:hypothetical protein